MEDILDYDLLTYLLTGIEKDSIKQMMNESEEIIWTGKPKYEFSLTPLELGGFDVALGPTNLYFIGLGICLFYSYCAYQESNYLLAVVLVLAGLLLFCIPDIVKEIRRRKTLYVATDQNLFFNLWKFNLLKGGKQTLYKIPIEDIHDLRYEEYKDKSGTLYVLSLSPSVFKTYDFSSSKDRHYPTFENIENVVALNTQILEVKKKLKFKKICNVEESITIIKSCNQVNYNESRFILD